MKPFKSILLGFGFSLVFLSIAAVFPYSPPQVTPLISGTVINNIFTTNLFNILNVTNLNVSVISNYTDINITTNVNVTQNFSVSGKATFNNITITNQLAFTTNAFPLSAGTTWNLTKPYQLIQTNNDIVIGALGGLTNNAVNWGVLIYSNSDSATHFMDLTALKVHLIGSASTNKCYVASGGEVVASIMSWGVGVMTNLVTANESNK